jgi:hypothetical protein
MHLDFPPLTFLSLSQTRSGGHFYFHLKQPMNMRTFSSEPYMRRRKGRKHQPTSLSESSTDLKELINSKPVNIFSSRNIQTKWISCRVKKALVILDYGLWQASTTIKLSNKPVKESRWFKKSTSTIETMILFTTTTQIIAFWDGSIKSNSNFRGVISFKSKDHLAS